MRKWLGCCFILVLFAMPAFGQQVGSISGTVTSSEGEGLPGVQVEATSPVLPQPRSTVTSSTGEYRLPLLPPGPYELTFSMGEMGTQRRNVLVQLQQNSEVDVALAMEAVTDAILVISSSLTDPNSAELKTAIAADVIDSLPVGQEYRDLVKLIPGVQYTEDTTRGPSAGGSGQDNVYQFDGVNVTLPLFGTLSADPSSHDIDQISIVKGGADAVDFNRSGGFTINSISKSGTGAYHGELSYQVQTDGMTGARDVESDAEFQQDKDWLTASLGGPILRDRLFFYTSYYRPTTKRDSRSNLYGPVPDFESVRDEYFGKLSFAPTPSILIHGSYRDSERENTGASVAGEAAAGSTSLGDRSKLEIGIAEGSWVINDKSFLSFRYTDFANETSGGPDNRFGFPIRTDGSVRLDVGNLDTQGLLLVPQPIAGQTAYNAFIVPLIQRYGFLRDGQRVGGGSVGGGSTINDQDFYREAFQTGYDFSLGGEVSHEFHVGYQWSLEEEDLSRLSNGWGVITVQGGRTSFNGQPVAYEARFEQQSLLTAGGVAVPPIHSEFESQSLEFNDSIKWRNFSFNLGVLLSNDQLYGQGLREKSGTASGFELAPGHKYKMYELDFKDMVQPRLGAIWAYNQRDTVSASYARYLPAASSLPRAASWARNLRRSIRGFFAADGTLIGTDPVGSSSGKFFQDNLDPRSIDEYALSTARQFSRGWTARAHARYRYAANFWEDTPNTARVDPYYGAPAGIPRELYIPNLTQVRAEIGGSSYVIAELDGAFNKYYETGLEAEWRGDNLHFRGSYVWSHYYGNFDQDNTTVENDQAIFIGSSNLADDAGQQLWDNKYGNLRGDRRHQVKLFGYYSFPWNGSAGVYSVYQSGQPWEIWDGQAYAHLDSGLSDLIRYAEPAGSRTTDPHYQIDLNYTQNFKIAGRFDIQVRTDLFNAFDNQTGYNIQNRRNSAGFGRPRSFYDPRRLQLAVKFLF